MNMDPESSEHDNDKGQESSDSLRHCDLTSSDEEERGYISEEERA